MHFNKIIKTIDAISRNYCIPKETEDWETIVVQKLNKLEYLTKNSSLNEMQNMLFPKMIDHKYKEKSLHEYGKLREILTPNMTEINADIPTDKPLSTRGIFSCPPLPDDIYNIDEYRVIHCWGILPSRISMLIDFNIRKKFFDEPRSTHLAYVRIESVEIKHTTLSEILKRWPEDVWGKISAEAIRITKNLEDRLKNAQEIVENFYVDDIGLLTSRDATVNLKKAITDAYQPL